MSLEDAAALTNSEEALKEIYMLKSRAGKFPSRMFMENKRAVGKGGPMQTPDELRLKTLVSDMYQSIDRSYITESYLGGGRIQFHFQNPTDSGANQAIKIGGKDLILDLKYLNEEKFPSTPSSRRGLSDRSRGRPTFKVKEYLEKGLK